ncbi:ABC transporter permease [Faecalicatena contorta]|uniref:ABC transporter permease n=1 Tax=Faecalicatena contorta TaxID=39482 RepID=UPI00129E483C|nr:ABC transporter permease [Faecalicatena contorta]MRM86910.1 ABC transporter permease [Faecalicatena contorta]
MTLKEGAKRLIKSDTFVLAGILFVLIVLFSVQSPFFLNFDNILNVLRQITEIAIVALPLTLIVVCGAMDLSVGSIVGMSAITLGICFERGLPLFLGVIAAFIVGTMCGLLNGFFVAKLKMMPIMVTIGTMSLFRGIIYGVTNARPISGFPKSFFTLGQGDVLGIPINVLVTVVIYIIGIFTLNKTIIGRYLYCMGNNEGTVLYSGINIHRIRMVLYGIEGALCALAGICYVSRLGSAETTLGMNMELEVLTAVLLGGTNIFGGKGKLSGTILGVLIIGILRNGLNLLGVSALYQMVAIGVLILIAVSRQVEKEQN